jgi:filamentous hemagglutinin
LHHIATNKNTKRGKKWTNRFKPFFDNAGLDMDGADNKVYVPGHKGPHPDAYHQHVFDKLSEATDNIDPIKDKQKYQDAVKSALSNIATDAQSGGTNVNSWLLKI